MDCDVIAIMRTLQAWYQDFLQYDHVVNALVDHDSVPTVREAAHDWRRIHTARQGQGLYPNRNPGTRSRSRQFVQAPRVLHSTPDRFGVRGRCTAVSGLRMGGSQLSLSLSLRPRLWLPWPSYFHTDGSQHRLASSSTRASFRADGTMAALRATTRIWGPVGQMGIQRHVSCYHP
jgi:hypothetical protein